MQYRKELIDLRNSYKKILDDNVKCLKKIKKIRNKYEHILHNVRPQSCFKGNDSWFEYGFEVENIRYKIESKELIKLFKDLNILYDKLTSEVMKYVYDNNLNNVYGFLSRINILGFNKLYESNLLYEIGKAIAGI